ncbi:hypothetical protein FB451DRAFT_1550925 [Mycena latifolia]|nr:hypothetical protein FB451DRAFT_1550925 [Mycena latifolia]
MHRGLRIPEIVHLIFTEIKRPFTGHELRVFVALSQTCTTFRDPALDLLWSGQDTLLHFLDTFPHDLIEEVQDKGSFHLLRPVCPSDWERPLLYSRRMKSLSLRRWPVSRTTFEALSLSCPGGYMFPDLQVLRLTYPPLSATSIDFLISPQLKEIRLNFGREFRLLCQIVPTLSVKCPSLTCVDISVDHNYDASTLQAVSDVVRSSSRIEVLIFLKLEDPKVPWTLALPVDAAASPQHMYSSLIELHFGFTTVDRITAFIQVVSNPPLKKLEAELLGDAATSDVIGRLYSALVAHCSHDSLQDISMHGGFLSESASPDPYRIHGATLRILFCFGNMVFVELHQCSGFDLDDTDIFDMASAWPRLEFLSLTGNTDDWLKEPRITVQGFLRTLDVLCSPIQTPKAVAAFLASIFPQVDIHFDRDGDLDPGSEAVEYGDRWAEVQQSLEDLREQKGLDKGGLKAN